MFSIPLVAEGTKGALSEAQTGHLSTGITHLAAVALESRSCSCDALCALSGSSGDRSDGSADSCAAQLFQTGEALVYYLSGGIAFSPLAPTREECLTIFGDIMTYSIACQHCLVVGADQSWFQRGRSYEAGRIWVWCCQLGNGIYSRFGATRDPFVWASVAARLYRSHRGVKWLDWKVIGSDKIAEELSHVLLSIRGLIREVQS